MSSLKQVPVDSIEGVDQLDTKSKPRINFPCCEHTSKVLTIEIMKDNLGNHRNCEDLHLAIRNVLNLSSLKPCPSTNAAFTHLVEAVLSHGEADGVFGSIFNSIDPGLVNRVQQVAAEAEVELESMWARRIANSTVPEATLAQFPYYANYEKLVRRELDLVAQSGLRIRSRQFRVLFVGSGPLAMTSILLHKALPHAYIENLDICLKAITLSQRVAKALALGPGAGFTHGDGATVTMVPSKAKFDLILVAALAGTTPAKKQAIVDNLRHVLAPGGRLLLRSAVGARELLYPAVQVSKLDGVKVLLEHHPTDDVINSIIVCQLA